MSWPRPGEIVALRHPFAPSPSRPAWVNAAIDNLGALEQEINAMQERLVALSLTLREHNHYARSDELNEAHHDIGDAGAHVVSLRRGLVMAWPDGRG